MLRGICKRKKYCCKPLTFHKKSKWYFKLHSFIYGSIYIFIMCFRICVEAGSPLCGWLSFLFSRGRWKIAGVSFHVIAYIHTHSHTDGCVRAAGGPLVESHWPQMEFVPTDTHTPLPLPSQNVGEKRSHSTHTTSAHFLTFFCFLLLNILHHLGCRVVLASFALQTKTISCTLMWCTAPSCFSDHPENPTRKCRFLMYPDICISECTGYLYIKGTWMSVNRNNICKYVQFVCNDPCTLKRIKISYIRWNICIDVLSTMLALSPVFSATTQMLPLHAVATQP